MNLIKFPSPNLTNNSNKASTSLLYHDWEIDEVIENLSEDEQDLLIERISLLAQSWELTLDSELEGLLQRKYKEAKTTFAYTDWLYDLAQEQVYRAYAIEQLDKQRDKVSIGDKKGNQSLAASNDQAATTPTDLSADQTTNNNSLLDYEEQINQIIENLSEVEQDALIEKSVLLFEQWESTTDAGLKLALKLQHQKSLPNIPHQDFLYDLAQSQVYREYAIEQLELAKQNDAKFVGQSVEIEKVYCDKIINDEVTTNNNSKAFIGEQSFSNKISLDCHQANVSSKQGYQEILTSLKDCASHHITKSLSNHRRNFPIKYINQQNSNFALANYSWKNSLSLTKAKKALLMHVHQGKPASIHHPPSLPP